MIETEMETKFRRKRSDPFLSYYTMIQDVFLQKKRR